ncbi:MAG: TonB-dependent receptor, partial [Acidobacteria bacterium]|nr:TonB-dependent receptor [Acidobacteriota bacterium]
MMTKNKRKFLTNFLTLGLLIASPPLVLAQLTTGTLSGTVTDATRAVLPGVTVTVRNADTGLVRTLITDAQGRYEAPNLPVGNYRVSAELAGFRTAIRSGIRLTVGRHAVVDLVLEIGELAEQLTVIGEAPLLETASATVSSLVDERRVTELPLNNRDLTQLAYLQPGVIKVPRRPGGTFASQGMGDTITVAGAREVQNIYMLDGIVSGDLSGNAQGAMGAYVGAETVQEFQVITNNYSAEYRSQVGAIVSAVTKSGTNELRGSLFWFHRNDNLDAANFFDNAFHRPKPEFKRNQFGGSLGGPIVRDRTFFFTSYEGLRERLGTTSSARVPSVEARQGILPGRRPGDPPRVVPVAPVVKPYLDLYPVPGQGNAIVGDLGDGTVRIAGLHRQPTNGDFFVVKIDHRFGTERGGSLSATYNFDVSDLSRHTLLGDDVSGDRRESDRHIVSLKHTSIWSPTLLNELHFGYSFTQPTDNIPLSTRDFGQLVFIPNRKLIGQINPGQGISSIGFRLVEEPFEQRVFTIWDGLSWTRGNHSMRMGVELNPIRYRQFRCAAGCNGIYEFRSLEDFLRAQPNRFEAALPGGRPERHLSQFLFGAYFQDNWAVRRAVTLNLGLRYEFVTVPKEREGLTSNLRNLTDTDITIGPMYTNATLKSFSPRVGFAWAPGSRKTSLRGGFGIFYDHPMFFHFLSAIQALPPFAVTGRLEALDAQRAGTTLRFPDAFTTQLDLLRAQPTIRAPQYELATTYGYRWSLTLQRQVATDWVVSAGYTGSRFLHLWVQTRTDLNRWEGWPAQPSGRKFFPEGAIRIFPAWGDLRIQFSKGNAFHHGLILSAQKRFSRGFDAQLNYSYSKTIDEGSALTSGGFEASQRSVYSSFDSHLERGLAGFDV